MVCCTVRGSSTGEGDCFPDVPGFLYVVWDIVGEDGCHELPQNRRETVAWSFHMPFS